MSNSDYNKGYNSDIIKCRSCKDEITFRKEIRGKNDKMRPLNLDGSFHNCPVRIQKDWRTQQSSDSISNKMNSVENKNISSRSPTNNQLSLYQISEKIEYTSRQIEEILIKTSFIDSQITEILQFLRDTSHYSK